MLHYRLYFMSPSNGHIMRFDEIEAPDDGRAVALAHEHRGDHALELWRERCKVVRIEPVDPAERFLAKWQAAREAPAQSSLVEA